MVGNVGAACVQALPHWFGDPDNGAAPNKEHHINDKDGARPDTHKAQEDNG